MYLLASQKVPKNHLQGQTCRLHHATHHIASMSEEIHTKDLRTHHDNDWLLCRRTHRYLALQKDCTKSTQTTSRRLARLPSKPSLHPPPFEVPDHGVVGGPWCLPREGFLPKISKTHQNPIWEFLANRWEKSHQRHPNKLGEQSASVH